MNEDILNHISQMLKNHKLKTMELSLLQDTMPGNTDYRSFASIINKLIDDGVLTPIKAKGTNRKTSPLPNKFTIGHGRVHEEHYQRLKRARLRFHSSIDLSSYYRLSPAVWEKDQDSLAKLDAYLQKQGLPQKAASLQERSFEIFDHEKWLESKEGTDFLARVGLSLERLSVVPVPDPCMFAMQSELYKDPQRLCHEHLIVENKTPYHVLMPLMHQQRVFTTLIYGQGKAIISTLQGFTTQAGFCLGEQNHTFHYYGDLDHEGISIWYSLQKRYPIRLALPFYRALLQKEYAIGKENQRPNPEAFALFLTNFSSQEQAAIQSMMDQGGYLPQEALSAEETANIWRNQHGSASS
ncbi:cytosolic protein [Heliobacterium chlorum]|uniref:Cytosolic protein n=1 Tax=Heliobacterium chlorum TaxID=2698 RepID=A0ABR7T5N9_HELCL|nr:Wadjet anti-phage system protein JetD domain-containing protein [Heliobacterium chlorum]MBC9786095.1 cytosolic protein [Heliobacterium chlorum]